MSIIDRKGKLFGKLNIIDLIAIILIVAVIALVGYKLVSAGGGSGTGQKVVYTVKVRGVEGEVYTSIKEQLPSQLMAAEQMLDAYVTDVQATPVTEGTYTIKENADVGLTTLTHAYPGTYDLIFTIEGTVKDDLTSELGTQEIRVGKTHIVKTTTFELENGIILTCERGGSAGGTVSTGDGQGQ